MYLLLKWNIKLVNTKLLPLGKIQGWAPESLRRYFKNQSTRNFV